MSATTTYCRRIALFLAATLLGGLAFADDNLLKNGDFESGGAGPATNWMTIWPRSIQDPAPDFGHPEKGALNGDFCASLETFKPGGFTSFTQKVRGDSKATVATLRGWVRVDELDAGASVKFLLLFLDEDGTSISMHSTRQQTEVCDWTELELEVPIPEGADSWMVRCGLGGRGKVAFDDVELMAERLRGEHVAAHLAAHFGTYVVRTENKVKGAWIAVSTPFPFERQTPLALRVTSDPPDLVDGITILEDGENRPLKVLLKELERDTEVRLRIETLAMVADRPLSDGVGIDLAKPKRVPKEVRPHLDSAPGIDTQAEAVKEAAQGFDRKDFASLMRDVTEFLERKLTYSAGSGQGAEECLERGEAVCTGFANVAASVLIAADVPTRILASTQMEGRLQEHYIVEAWTPELGWSRLESTMAEFPWADTKNLIVRVVYPDARRNSGDVPIYVELSSKITGGFALDPDDQCWQGADSLANLLAPSDGFEKVEEAARKAFAALERKPAKGSSLSLVPRGKDAKKLKLDQRTARLLEEVENWLGEE